MKRFLFIFLPLAMLAAGSIVTTKYFPVKASPNVTTGFPTPTPASQPTPPAISVEEEVLKVDTELVNLNIRVVDRGNRPINGLRQNEFKIYEDNVLQQIDFFSKSEVPTNYSLVIDNSGSMRQQLEKVIEAGKIIIDTNKPGDETSIIRFISREKITVEQQFTDNKADLNDALDNMFIEGGNTAIIDSVYLAAENIDNYKKAVRSNDRRRKAVIVVSDGEDRDSYYTETQLFQLLRETDVQVYTIGFVGDLNKDGGFISKSPQNKAKAFLQRMSAETGGKAYFPVSVSDLAGIAADIASDLRIQYSIGYIPSNDRHDGTYRNIKVSVNDGPNSQKRIAITRTGRNAEKD